MKSTGELFDVAERLQTLLIHRATGEHAEESEYVELRNELRSDPLVRKRCPGFLLRARSLFQFWEFIKYEFSNYAERRQFIWSEFGPLLEYLEDQLEHPLDDPTSELLRSFGAETVHSLWARALERRASDPAGAITLARTLLEAVCKHLLDDAGVDYSDRAELPKLYRDAALSLNIAPSQHTEDVFKQILGGCTSVVEGLGALRNRLSDAHGAGRLPAKPATRHAELAVNLAGSMATFLVSTWEARAGEGGSTTYEE